MTGRSEETEAPQARGGEAGPKEDPRTPVLIALCAAGFALFNFPLLALWGGEAEVFGLPLTPVALFLVWGGLIAALAWVLERRRP